MSARRVGARNDIAGRRDLLEEALRQFFGLATVMGERCKVGQHRLVVAASELFTRVGGLGDVPRASPSRVQDVFGEFGLAPR